MVSISLCMIVRNEEKVLERCLDSVCRAVDEMIIVDTGSVDSTKEIAGKYTDKVYDFVWVDDFSAARNFSFSKAAMDYCMWMDADDVMEESSCEKLIQWKQNHDRTADVVMMKYSTAFDENGKSVFYYYRERLLKREKNFQWKGRVHEAIEPSGKIEYLDAQIQHWSEKEVYGDRNLRIYEKMKQEGEHFTPRDFFYYARELYYHKRYMECVEKFEEFLQMPDGFVENRVEACRIAAYASYFLKKEEQALGYLLRALRERVPSGELCCDLGKHFMDRKEWRQAEFWFRSALWVAQNGKDGGFVSEEYYGYLPCIQLSVCYERMGQKELALYYHRKAGRYKPYGAEYLRNQKYFSGMEHIIG